MIYHITLKITTRRIFASLVERPSLPRVVTVTRHTLPLSACGHILALVWPCVHLQCRPAEVFAVFRLLLIVCLIWMRCIRCKTSTNLPRTGKWSFSYTANPTCGDIFEFCFKAQSSKLESLFSLKRGKRDVRALSFELSKMTPQVGLAVPALREYLHYAKALLDFCNK